METVDKKMPDLYFSCKNIKLDTNEIKIFSGISQPEFSICQLDSKKDWDAEKKGEEQDYWEFINFIGRLIFALAEDKTIKASYTQGNPNLDLVSKANLKFRPYPVGEVEEFINFIFSKFGLKKGRGSRTEIYLPKVEDFEKLIKLKPQSNDWLFLIVGSDRPAEWSDFEPSYIEKKGYLDFLESIFNSYFLFYHETNLNYCEILTSKLPPERIRNELLGIKSKFSIHF